MKKLTLIAAGIVALSGCNLTSTTNDVVQQKSDQSYLWLEEVQGEKALTWVKTQNKSALDVLTATPTYQSSFDKNLELLNSTDRIAYATQRGDYLYNFWQDKDHPRGIYRRTTLAEYQNQSPRWQTILDVDALAKTDQQSWVYKGMECLYPKYNRCLVSLSPGGSDAVVVKEFDIAAKSFVKNGFALGEAKSNISWRDINSVYVGTDFGQGSLTDSGYPRMVKLWHRGTPLSDAALLYSANKSSVAATGYRMFSQTDSVDVIYDSTTFYTSKVFINKNGKNIELAIPHDADMSAYLNQQLFIQLKSDWTVKGQTFSQGSVIYAKLEAILAGNPDYKLLIEPTQSLSISSIKTTKSALLVTVLDNVKSKVLRFSNIDNQWQSKAVNIDDSGTVSVFNTNESSDDFFINYTSFLSPNSLYKVDGTSGELSLLKSQQSTFNSDNLETKQFWATSKDGTKIPYFAVMKKGLKLDGTNPTLLYGYGGFEVSLKPYYSSILGSNWLDKGGVYILSNIRGGGEFGPRWHQAALKTNRHKAYEDFEAIALDLIERGITSPDHLGIQGGSNGGLLMGAAFTRRPDLYNAVVCQVP